MQLDIKDSPILIRRCKPIKKLTFDLTFDFHCLKDWIQLSQVSS
jgi:hypothetical protein